MKLIICFLLSFCCYLSQVSAQAQKPAEQVKTTNTTANTNIVARSPGFPGGYKKFAEFLSDNIKWPDKDLTAHGVVYVGFVVEPDGTITNVRVLKSMSPKFDAEAVRVVKLSPKWIPVTLNGNPVRSQMQLPISFTLTVEHSTHK